MQKIDFESFMRRKKITQKELAKLLGVAQQTISLYCQSKSDITFGRVAKLVELGMTPEELFGETAGKIMRETILSESLKIVPDSDFEKRVITVLNKVFKNESIKISFQ